MPAIESTRLRRMALAYGTDIYQIIGDSDGAIEQGQDFGCGLFQAEVDFLIANEWARTAEDILMRRTKLGYVADKAVVARLEDYLKSI